MAFNECLGFPEGGWLFLEYDKHKVFIEMPPFSLQKKTSIDTIYRQVAFDTASFWCFDNPSLKLILIEKFPKVENFGYCWIISINVEYFVSTCF